jgi:uncharacterized protein YbjT (DUF2867 family)
MPVIVVGADSLLGEAILGRLQARAGEARAFVSDLGSAPRLRASGVKVAVGDVSDVSHVEGAAIGAFTAVLIAAAATDGRETAFADPPAVVEGWIRAVAAAGVTRIILVGDTPPAAGLPAGTSYVDARHGSPDEIAGEVAAIDDAARL